MCMHFKAFQAIKDVEYHIMSVPFMKVATVESVSVQIASLMYDEVTIIYLCKEKMMKFDIELKTDHSRNKHCTQKMKFVIFCVELTAIKGHK